VNQKIEAGEAAAQLPEGGAPIAMLAGGNRKAEARPSSTNLVIEHETQWHISEGF
jgi:hypothetical protein